MHCDQCGAMIPDYAKFCRKCGARQFGRSASGETGRADLAEAIAQAQVVAQTDTASPRQSPASSVPGEAQGRGPDLASLFVALIVLLIPVAVLLAIGQKSWPSLIPAVVPTGVAEIPVPAPLVAPLFPTATPEPEPTRDPNAVLFTKYVSADGDGVYIRYAPDREAKVKAWPDGTPMGVIDFLSDWIKVRDPDGYIGYVPRDYLSDWPPSTPSYRAGRAYEVTLNNLRYERWGGPIDSEKPCGPTSNGIPSRRVAYELIIKNLSNQTFNWQFGLALQLGGKVWMNSCCYRYGVEQGIAPPIPPGSTATVTCFSFINDSWGDMASQQRISMTWLDETHSWRLVNGKAIVEQ